MRLFLRLPRHSTCTATDHDVGDRHRDFSRDKRLAPARALMIEQNPVAAKHPVRFPVVDDTPVP